jgi:hypothetical protein
MADWDSDTTDDEQLLQRLDEEEKQLFRANMQARHQEMLDRLDRENVLPNDFLVCLLRIQELEHDIGIALSRQMITRSESQRIEALIYEQGRLGYQGDLALEAWSNRLRHLREDLANFEEFWRDFLE